VKDSVWLKLLEVLQKRLGASDARIELGGRDPKDARCVWAPLDEGRRVVALFDEPPPDRALTEARLLALIESFRETAAQAEPPPGRGGYVLRRELDEALAALAERTGAESVWIIDVHSPVVWGCSEAVEPGLDLDLLLRTARADQMLARTGLTWAELLAAPLSEGDERLRESKPGAVALRALSDELRALSRLAEEGGLRAAARRLRAARALAEIRQRAARDRDLVRSELRGPLIQCFAHAIAGQYQLVLVFDETYSPLHAEANVQRALPHVERLLLSLPPVDPMAGGGGSAKVIRLPRKG
jgi:hypothetical protein